MLPLPATGGGRNATLRNRFSESILARRLLKISKIRIIRVILRTLLLPNKRRKIYDRKRTLIRRGRAWSRAVFQPAVRSDGTADSGQGAQKLCRKHAEETRRNLQELLQFTLRRQLWTTET